MSLGIAEDLSAILSKFKFWTTVNEYENGLYYSGGRARIWRISDNKLDYILEKEWEERQQDIEIENISAESKPPRSLNEVKSLEEKAYKEFLKNYYGKNIFQPDYSSKTYFEFENSNMKKYEYDMNNTFLWFSEEKPKFNPSFSKKYSTWQVSASGNPLHPTRFRKNLPYGVYPHIPTLLGLQEVNKMSTAEIVKDLKVVSLMANGQSIGVIGEFKTRESKDGNSANSSKEKIQKYTVQPEFDYDLKKITSNDLESVIIGGMLRYKIEDVYKTYNNVADWESSYQSQAMIIISKYCRGRYLSEFFDGDFLNGLEKNLKEELDKMPRKSWGIKTKETGIFTASKHILTRNIQELSTDGLYINLATAPENKNE